MKLLKKLFKMNNKGMSLVELICAVAILGLAVAALGGAMVMSARHYQRDSAEFEVQQEAQVATNLIGNLIVDAATVNWAPELKTLTITADSTTYVIKQVGDKLTYTQGADSGILAEGVADNGFKVDDTAFKNNKNVNISLTLKDGEKEITADYNATARNGKLSSTEKAESAAYISMEQQIVVEPKQSYETKITVMGGLDASDYGPLTLDLAGVPTEWQSKISIEDEKLKIKAPDNAQGDVTFFVQTANKPGTANPYDKKEVTVKIRRVNGIAPLNQYTATAYTKDHVFGFSTSILGQNLPKGYGKDYDKGTYEYKNPKYVAFYVETSGGLELDPSALTITRNEDVDNPSVTIKLNRDMVPGETFKVWARAKHSEGKIGGVSYNKEGEWYATYDTLPITITCPNIDSPIPMGPTASWDSGIERGQDFVWNVAEGEAYPSYFANILKDAYTIKNGDIVVYQPTIKFNWYVRFKKDTDTNWPIYHKAKEDGSTQKLSGTGESRVMLPDEAYSIQFFMLYTDESDPNNKKVLWPNDNSLFTDGGFGTSGYVKGWDDADATATSFEQYGKTYPLPATELVYYDNVYENDDNFLGMPSDGTAVNTVSTTLSVSAMDGKMFKLHYQTFHLDEGQSDNIGEGLSGSYSLKPVFYKKEGGEWKDKTHDYIKNNVLKFEYPTGGSSLFLTIKEIGKNVPLSEAEGEYRVGFELTGVYTEYTNTTNVNDASFDYDLGTWDLFKEGSDDGFFYFTITN